ncbi:MAG: lysoplasmalogenase family protein [Pseudomonadota bacterium]
MIPLVIASLFGAVLAGLYQAKFVGVPVSWLRSAIKTFSILGFAMAFAVLAPGYLDDTEFVYRQEANPLLYLVAAFGLSAFGDFFLSRDGENAFFFGILAFGLAQFFFIVAILVGLQGIHFAPYWYRWTIAGLAFVALIFLPRSLSVRVRFAILSYGAALLSMGWFAVQTQSPWIIGGAGLFILSDAMIAVGLYDNLPKHVARLFDQAVWATYWPAQLLLAWGFYLAL